MPTAVPTPSPESVRRDVRAALEEDLGERGDLTSDTLFPGDARGSAVIVAREPLILAGLPWAVETFRRLDPMLRVETFRADGEALYAGTLVARLEGRLRPLLAGERTALNFLMRMSGVATVTAAAVAEVEGTGCSILDTRKTIPGWRRRDKYAVLAGGGRNHRMGLWDAAMIKDTHLGHHGDLASAVRALLAAGIPPERVTAEVRSVAQLQEAIDAGAGRALLDNMSLEELRECVSAGKGRIVLEASGGLRPGGLRAVAETGIDCLSVGWITHSAPAADLAMESRS